MADLFNFGEVEERENVGGGNSQKYIYPGIRHHVVIKDVKAGKNANNTPFIELIMYTKEGGPEAARSFNLYTSPGALPKTQEKLKHIATKVATLEEVEAARDVEALRDLLKGKSLRMKFIGREYKNSNGELKERAEIGLAPFAEAIEEGAAYPVVSDEDTKLTFDKTNQYDFQKLEEEESVTVDPAAMSGSSAPWSVG